MATVSIRMDDALKRQTETASDQLGLNMTTAVTMFAKAVVRENGPVRITNQNRMLRAFVSVTDKDQFRRNALFPTDANRDAQKIF